MKTPNSILIPKDVRRFYDMVYEKGNEPDAAFYEGREDYERFVVNRFIEQFCMEEKMVLEVGCGHAPYQGRIANYFGTDISRNCSEYLSKPFFVASATALPVKSNSFDGLLSLHTLEHIHHPESALTEILRVLKPGRAAFILPSWFVRSWAGYGLRVRTYSELSCKLRITKFFLPIFDSVFFRGLAVFPRRAINFIRYIFAGNNAIPLRYKTVSPNYTKFLDSDSDACNWIDPFDVILFFQSRGCRFPDQEGWFKKIFFRSGHLLIVMPESFENQC